MLAIAVTASPSSAHTARAGGELDALVEAARDRHRVPGLAAALYSSDGVIEVAAAGVRHAGTPTALETGDLLHIGSLTKALTVTLVATLVERGELEWTSRVLDVLPELRTSARRAYRAVTVADVADHRAGVRAWTSGRSIPCYRGKGETCFEGSLSEQRLAAARWLLARRPLTRPGRFRYSNAGYVILAAIAERAGGAPWETLLRDRVLAPLGVAPAFGWPLDAGADQPSGHQRHRGRWVPVEPDAYRLPGYLAPAGDVSLTLAGYAEFGRLHLRAARGEGTAILDPAALRAIQPTGTEQHGGWQAGVEGGVAYFAGEGSAGTFHAMSFVVPSADRGIIVVTNAGGPRARKAALEVALQTLRG